MTGDEILFRQLLQVLLQGLAGESLAQNAGGKTKADDRRHLEQVGQVFRQPVDTGHHEPLQRIRHFGEIERGAGRQFPVFVRLMDDALADQHPNEFFQVKGVSLGSLVQGALQIGREMGDGKQGRQKLLALIG